MAKKAKILSKSGIDYDLALDKIEAETDNQSVVLTAGQRVKGCISSGALCFDLITGGGFPPGKNLQLVGPEQSGNL